MDSIFPKKFLRRRPLMGIVMTVLLVIAVIIGAGAVLAADDTVKYGPFEVDGDTVATTTDDDWDTLYPSGGGSAILTTFVTDPLVGEHGLCQT